MKTLLKSIKITLVFCVFFSVFYILVLWLFAQVAGPNRGNAEVVTLNGKVVGAANVGQTFTEEKYFWGRPHVPVMAMMQPVRQVAIKGRPILNIWQRWRHASILSLFIIRIWHARMYLPRW